MVREQVAMGLGIVGLCLLGLRERDWLLAHSRLAGVLLRGLGPIQGPRMLITLLLAGVLFGILLAADCVRPARWN